MKFLPENATMEDLAKEFDRLYRRVKALEQASSVILPRSAPRSPVAGQEWYDGSKGTRNVFNGTSWDVWTKD
jgi:hypothetical protein